MPPLPPLTVGLDFGTTNSCVALYTPSPTSSFGAVKTLRLDVATGTPTIGSRLKVGNMPTNVSVTVTVEGKNIVMTKEGREECEVYMPGVGEDATDALLSFKRALSKGGGGVEEPLSLPPYTTSPATAITCYLKLLHASLQRHLTPQPLAVFLTHPCNYTARQKSLLTNCALGAGFVTAGLMTESNAAGFAYGIGKNSKKESTHLVVDVGGGTTDVSVIKNGRVVGVAGDNELGGDDVDAVVGEWFWGDGRVVEKTHVGVFRKAKETLCGELWDEEGGDFDDSFDPDPPPKSATVALSGVTKTLWGSAFLALLQPLVPRFKTVITRALALAGLKESDVSAVILTGGSSRLPVLAPLLHDLFPGVSLKNDVNPFSCVAIGAALKGAVTSGRIEGWELDNALMSEILPHRMGVVGEEDTLITVCEAGSTLPCRCSAVFEVADVDQGGVVFAIGEDVGEKIEGVGEFRFMLWRLSGEQKREIENEEGGVRRVELFLGVDCEGKVVVEIYDKYDPEHVKKFGKGGEDTDLDIEKEGGGEAWMIGLCVVLFLCYVAVRVSFNVVIENDVEGQEGVAKLEAAEAVAVGVEDAGGFDEF